MVFNHLKLLKLVLIILLNFVACTEDRQNKKILNGFRTQGKSLVLLADIISGGPARDGIPAITKPKFTDISLAKWLKDDDLVVGVYKGSQAKAYPIRILAWHEVVNDKIAEDNIVVSYSPLTGSAVTFKANYETTFGISGLLYQSSMIMYDHQTDSLWPQLKFQAVTGRRAGEILEIYPSSLLTWKAWKQKYPATLVLSTDTGSQRNYSLSPYADYQQKTKLLFPVKNIDKRLPPKTEVFVVIVAGQVKAYPMGVFLNKNKLEDLLAGTEITIKIIDGRPASAYSDNQQLQTINTFWFAWYNLNPNTLLYKINEEARS